MNELLALEDTRWKLNWGQTMATWPHDRSPRHGKLHPPSDSSMHKLHATSIMAQRQALGTGKKTSLSMMRQNRPMLAQRGHYEAFLIKSCHGTTLHKSCLEVVSNWERLKRCAKALGEGFLKDFLGENYSNAHIFEPPIYDQTYKIQPLREKQFSPFQSIEVLVFCAKSCDETL